MVRIVDRQKVQPAMVMPHNEKIVEPQRLGDAPICKAANSKEPTNAQTIPLLS